MLRNVNKDPRRWIDGSGRVRVVEGWHPSAPDQVGFNLLVDGDWLGTFASLDDAAAAAPTGLGDPVELRLLPALRRRRATYARAGMYVVPEPSGQEP